MRRKVLSISYLAAAFLVVAGFAIQGQVRASTYERQLNNQYRHAFAELATAAAQMDTALEKSLYATSDALRTQMYGQIYAKALAAQYALGELPYSNVELEQTAAFFAKTGDYAISLTRGGAGEEATTLLGDLSAIAKGITTALFTLEEDLNNGALAPEDISAATARLAASAIEDGKTNFNGGFQEIEGEFPEFPTLVYDGPFSEHLTGRTPKQLEGMEQVTAQEGRQVVADFLGCSVTEVTFLSSGGGKLPAYSYTATAWGGTAYVEVTCQGGRILAYLNDRMVDGGKLAHQQGVAIGQERLAAWGYPEMKPSYFIEESGILTIHFAPVVDGVYYYPDLVKVSVALDDGTVMGFEGQGYLIYHTQRTLPSPAVPMEVAAGTVPQAVTVLASQLVLIPTAGEGEVLCYEFKSETATGEHLLLYVNASTGQQEKILLLVEEENGTLVL